MGTLILFNFHLNIIITAWWKTYLSADSRFAPSQWEAALLCNDVSHWLAANLESALSLDYNNSTISCPLQDSLLAPSWPCWIPVTATRLLCSASAGWTWSLRCSVRMRLTVCSSPAMVRTRTQWRQADRDIDGRKTGKGRVSYRTPREWDYVRFCLTYGNSLLCG